MLIRPAQDFLLSELRQLANPPHVAYTHLDWLAPEERLLDDSTFALEEDDRLCATISLAPETPDFAWLRFFFSLQDGKHQEHFGDLLNYGKKWLAQNKVNALYSLSHQNGLRTCWSGTALKEQVRSSPHHGKACPSSL